MSDVSPKEGKIFLKGVLRVLVPFCTEWSEQIVSSSDLLFTCFPVQSVVMTKFVLLAAQDC